MLGGVVEDNPARRVAEKSRSGSHRLQDAALAFDPQVDRQVRLGGHVTDQAFRLVDIETVRDEMPLADGGFGFHRALDVRDEVDFVAGIPIGDLPNPASGNMEVDHKGLRAMSFVLELLAFHSPRLHGQVWMLAFQRLAAGQFIGADHLVSLGDQVRRLPVKLVEVGHLLIEVLIRFFGRQPTADQMRLEMRIFLKASPHAEAKSVPQCRVAGFHRLSHGRSNWKSAAGHLPALHRLTP
jgi:hypothetical protein